MTYLSNLEYYQLTHALLHSSRIRILQILRIVKITNFKTADEFYYFVLYFLKIFNTFLFYILQFVSHTGAIITIMPCCVRVNC